MSYTIEQIEYLRKHADVTYEEAVEVLEYFRGDMAKALVELEKRGKIRGATQTSTNGEDFKDNVKKAYDSSISHRFVVKKDKIVIMNLSVLFALISLIVAPHLTITALIVAIVLGYKISISKEDSSKYSFDHKETVNNAAENFKSTFKDFTEEPVKDNTKSDVNSTEKYNEITVE